MALQDHINNLVGGGGDDILYQVADKYGYDSNWNGLRDSDDPLIKQLKERYGMDANFNALRPQRAGSGPSSSGLSSGPDRSKYEYDPESFKFPGGMLDPEGNNYNIPSENYSDYLKKLLASGVPEEDAKATADTVFANVVKTATGIANKYAYKGQNKHDDPNYWLDMWKKDPQYTWDRLIGKGAGRADAALAGPYAGGDGGGLSNPNANFQQFDDPAARLLEQLALDRVNRLSQNPDRRELEAFIEMLRQQQATDRARAGQFAETLRARSSELQKPPYSEGDEAVMRAKAFDQLERRRTQTLKNNREDIYARGFSPTSGLVVGADRDTNTQFEQARTGIESDLLNNSIQEGQRRKDRALQLEGLAQQALSGGDISALQGQAQIADFEDSLIADMNNRERERLAAAGIPVDLATNRTQLAMSILGQGGGNPSSIIQSLLGIGNFGQNQQRIDATNRASNMSGLGGLASVLQRLFAQWGM